jgi:chloride channel 7
MASHLHLSHSQDSQINVLHYDEASIEPAAPNRLIPEFFPSTLRVCQAVLAVLLATSMAALMLLVSNLVGVLRGLRVNTILELLRDGNVAGAFFFGLCFSGLLVATAAMLVLKVAPDASGGGVSYVLAYLNGTHVAHFFTWRILVVKTLALAPTIASGAPLGAEAPSVFLGGAMARLLLQGVRWLGNIRTSPQPTTYSLAHALTEPSEERIFMACGLATGLAVAFDAPIAGVLMALEGSVAFLTTTAILRIFGCAMLGAFFSRWAVDGFSPLIVAPSTVDEEAGATLAYAWFLSEVLFFVLISCIGAILGAVGTWLNMRWTTWRHHQLRLRMWDPIVLVAVTFVVWFALPWCFGCVPCGNECEDTMEEGVCAVGTFSPLGTLLARTNDEIVDALYTRQRVGTLGDALTVTMLITYGLIHFVLAVSMYGAHVPGGLFVPCIIVGACMGRSVAALAQLSHFAPSGIHIADPGVYALLGSAAVLGGMTRLALPITVMLIEMTGNATFLVPIMFCTVLSKVLADTLSSSLYSQHMHLEGYHSLGDQLPLSLRGLSVDTVPPLVTAAEEARKYTLFWTDTSLAHAQACDAFWTTQYLPWIPVVSCTVQCRFLGMTTLQRLQQRIGEQDGVPGGRLTFEQSDLDAGVTMLHPSVSLSRVHRCMRRLGLAFIVLVDEHHTFWSVVSRRDLVS